MLPGQEVTSIVAATWFSGETTFAPQVGPRDETEDDDEWLEDAARAAEVSRGARLINLSRRRILLEEQIKSLASLARQAQDWGTDGGDFVRDFRADIAAAQKEIEYINGELRATPGAVVVDNGG